ncbi:MAG TPA: winged helix-turn-helix transcriptional regulator [Candidatus Thermoplasmatota archaeon]|nr:winged helix-turn-helix transcriptional regulator [Candidatus Thermoplasmatota archaeon]
MSELLSLASRKRIYEHVEAHGGAHLREIGRKCDVPLGTALYHLDRLEAEGLITVRRDGRYKRYFAANGLGRREKDLLSAFRHAVPRRIGAALLERPSLTQRELCEAIGVSRSTLSFHVNSLIDKGILRREPARPENKYVLDDVELTRAILTKYRDSLGDFAPLRPPAPQSVPVAVEA